MGEVGHYRERKEVYQSNLPKEWDDLLLLNPRDYLEAVH